MGGMEEFASIFHVNQNPDIGLRHPVLTGMGGLSPISGFENVFYFIRMIKKILHCF